MTRTIIAASIILAAVALAGQANAQEFRPGFDVPVNADTWKVIPHSEQDELSIMLRGLGMLDRDARIVGIPPEEVAAHRAPSPFGGAVGDTIRAFVDFWAHTIWDHECIHEGINYSPGAVVNDKECTCDNDGCAWK